MQKRILRSNIDFYPVFNPEPFYRFEAFNDLLITPFVSRGDGKAKEIDLAGSIQLSGHHRDLAIVTDGVEVGVDNYFRRTGQRMGDHKR